MKDKGVAKRYAQGFLAFAKETTGEKRGLDDLTFLRQLINTNPEFRKFLDNSEITDAEKSVFIDKTFKDVLAEEAKEFLKLIIAKKRTQELADIADSAKVLYYREIGVEKALLKTARPISAEVIQTIKENLENKLQKKLEVEVKVDPAIIGGVQAIVGNVIIDGSVKRKLAELKELLMEIKVN